MFSAPTRRRDRRRRECSGSTRSATAAATSIRCPQRGVAAELARAALTDPQPARFLYHLGDVVYPHGEQAAIARSSQARMRPTARRSSRCPATMTAIARWLRADSTLDPLSRRSARTNRTVARRRGRGVASAVATAERLLDTRAPVAADHRAVHERARGRTAGDDQLAWLVGELRAAPADTITMLAMHQPIYSADVTHGSNLALVDAARSLLSAGRPAARGGADRSRPLLPAVHPARRRSRRPARRRRRRRLSRAASARAGHRLGCRCRCDGVDGLETSRSRITRIARTAF